MYPALATAQALLRDKSEAHRLHFVGAVGGMERALVRESGLGFASYHAIYAGPIHGVGPARLARSLIKLLIGSVQALFLLARLRPGAMLLTGGWANLPLALGARLLRIPIVIYLPDIEPGLTIKALQPFAKRVAISVDESARFFPPGKCVVTGYPLLANRLEATRAAGLARFELEAGRKTLLVFGGSRGARSLNMALVGCLGGLLDAGLQILHITGQLDWARSREQAGELADHPRYHAVAYLHDEMGLALAAAQLTVCRAGASALAELPRFGLPAILVPYPHAWRYQKMNADYLARRGAAIRLDDADLPAKLEETVLALLQDDCRLRQMRQLSRALARSDGAEQLARLLLETGGQR